MNISLGVEQTVHLIICSAMVLIVIVLMRKGMKFLEPRSACQREDLCAPFLVSGIDSYRQIGIPYCISPNVLAHLK